MRRVLTLTYLTLLASKAWAQTNPGIPFVNGSQTTFFETCQPSVGQTIVFGGLPGAEGARQSLCMSHHFAL